MASLFNCTGEDNTYACFPNDDITQLIEFCYPLQIISIPPGKNIYEIIVITMFTFFEYSLDIKNVLTDQKLKAV